MSSLGVVIAGGQSRRMGGVEKAFLPLGGLPLIEHVITRLKLQVDDLIINANDDPARFSMFGFAVVADELKHVSTPLAGLHAGLSYALAHGYSAIVTVPSDAPFVPDDLVQRLSAPTAIAGSAGQSHFLTGLWHVHDLPKLTEALTLQSLRRAQDWALQIDASVVEWSALPFDPFFNINTPTDLTLAASFLAPSC